jgi:hypothetical protein
VATDDATTRFGACVGVPVWQRRGLGVLAEHIPAGLVDQVLAETGRVQRRVRRLPARVTVWFVLALTLFHGQGYRSVWRELIHNGGDDGPTPSTSPFWYLGVLGTHPDRAGRRWGHAVMTAGLR